MNNLHTRYITIILLMCGSMAAALAQSVTYQYIVGKDITSAPKAGSTTEVGPIKITWGAATRSDGATTSFLYDSGTAVTMNGVQSTANYIKFGANNVSGNTDKAVNKDGGGIDASHLPAKGAFVRFDATESGTMVIGYRDGTGNYALNIIDAASASASSGTLTEISSASDSKSGTYTVNITAGHVYYMYINNTTAGGLYGFTFTMNTGTANINIWDFAGSFSSVLSSLDRPNTWSSDGTPTYVYGVPGKEKSAAEPLYLNNVTKEELFSGLLFYQTAVSGRRPSWLPLNANGLGGFSGGDLYVVIPRSFVPEGTSISVEHSWIKSTSGITTVSGSKTNATPLTTSGTATTTFESDGTTDDVVFSFGNTTRIRKITVTRPAGFSLLTWEERVTMSISDDMTAADYPALTNETGESTVTYTSSDESVVKVLGGNGTGTSYRIVGPGFAVVTAAAGGYEAACNFVITDKEGTGSYDSSTNKYTFTETGRLMEKTITDVDGLSLTIGNGSETAVVVGRDSKKGVKVIDGNGYFFRFKEGSVPTMGTFYKLVISGKGFFSATANVTSSTVLTNESGGNIELTASGNSLSTSSSIEPGTYFLYNDDTDDEQPLLLYDFSFVSSIQEVTFADTDGQIYKLSDDGLTFANAATSDKGGTVTYISSDESIATVAEDGTVTMTGKSGVTTITATAAAIGLFDAGSSSYDLYVNITGRWVFDDALGAKWTTTEDQIAGSKLHNDEQLLLKDETTVMPEAAGLYFKTANTSRFSVSRGHYIQIGAEGSVRIPNLKKDQVVELYLVSNSGTISFKVDNGRSTAGEVNPVSSVSTSGGTYYFGVVDDGDFKITGVNNGVNIRAIYVYTPRSAFGTLRYAGGATVPVNTIVSSPTAADFKDKYGSAIDGSKFGSLYDFAVDNAEMATVDAETGAVTTKDTDGTVLITAKARSLDPANYADATVTCALAVTSYIWTSNAFACYFGDDVSTRKPALLGSDGETITYSSSNPDVADFTNSNDYATLIILTTGATTITATRSDGTAVSYTMTITPKTWKIRESHPANSTLAEDFLGKTFDTATYWNRVPYNNPSITYKPTVTKNEFIKVYANETEQLFEGLQFSMTNNGAAGWLIHYTGVGFTITTNSSQQLVKIEKGYLPQGSTFKVYYTSYSDNTGGISVVSGADYVEGNLSLSTPADNEAVTFTASGDEDVIIAIDRNIGLSKIEVESIDPLEFKWKAAAGSYPLVEINADNTPAYMSKMVELKRNIDVTATVSYSSSEPAVAAFKNVNDYSSLHLKKVGTTVITAEMTDHYGLHHTSSYTLTLTGTQQTVTDDPDTEPTEGFGTWTSANNTFTFIAEGWTGDVSYENADFKGGGVIGLTATVGATGETHLIQAKSNSGNGFAYSIKSIDGNGNSTVTLSGGIPVSGSFMKFEATVEGAVLTATGTFKPEETVLMRVSNGGGTRGRAKTRAGSPEEVDVIFTADNTQITTVKALETGYSYYLYNCSTTMYIHSFGSSPKLVAGGDKYDLHGVEKGMVIELVVSAVKDEGTIGVSELTITQALATTHPVSGVSQTIITYAVTDEAIGDAENPNTVFIRVPLPQDGETYDDVIIHSARAFYKEPQLKLNYTPQAIYNHRENWSNESLKTHYANNVGIEEAFDLTGLPTFTALMNNTDYTSDFAPLTTGSGFAVTGNLELQGSDGTVRSTGIGTVITEGTVSVPVALTAVARGYATDSYTATIALPVIPFPYIWDFTSGISGKTTALILENVEEDSRPYMTLGPSSKEIVETREIDVGGGQTRERTSYNYVIDSELPNSRLSIPVMQGMQVNITFAPSAKERTTGSGYPMEISNVTDLKGNATAEVSILTERNTQRFIAGKNGYVELYNRSDVEVCIERIEVTAPQLEFEDGEEPEVSWSATYRNDVINQPIGSTLAYAKTDPSSIVKTMENDGTFTFNDNKTGTVTVTATATGAKGLEPAWGQYAITVRDFKFQTGSVVRTISGTTAFNSSDLNSLLIDGTAIGAEDLDRVSFSCSSPATYDGNTNNAKGILVQTSGGYTLEVRNDGQLVITATYRKEAGKISTLKTSFELNIKNNKTEGFKYPAPIIEAADGNTTYDFSTQNPFTNPAGVTKVRYETEAVSKGGGITASISGMTLTISGPGVVRVKAINDDGGENQDKLIDEFYLTVAYPVNETTSQSWDFTGGLHDKNGNSLTFASGDWADGMPPTTNRGSEKRYLKEVNGDNGFIVKETAGLQIIASKPSDPGNAAQGHFSVGTGSTSYPNIGLHQSTLVIPQLKKGQYVAVAWDRINDNVGNTMEASNLLDLEGKVIDEIKYGGSVNLTGGNAGKPQGYYTFRVAEDGNVSFTQNDNGTSRIVAIHVYYGDPDTSVSAERDANYNSNSTEGFRGSGMTETLISNTNKDTGSLDLSSALKLDGTFLIDGDHTTTQRLARYLAFDAPNGNPEFKMVDQDESIKGMTIDMSNEFYDSGNGMYAIPGLTFHGGWGKGVMSIGVRDNNGYLVAYRQYRFTVGQKPHQTYPKTWDFTRYFDNSTVKVVDSEVSSEAPAELDTKGSLTTNSGYARVTTNTAPTQTWASGNRLLRSSENDGETATYKQYGKNDYSSYYVDNAVLVCNQSERNVDGFIIPETNGLGFNISKDGNSLQWLMPTDGAGYKGTSYLEFGGTMTLGSVNDADHYADYYVFVNSSDSPTAGDNLEALPDDDDYEGITGTGQYAFHVSGNGDMTLNFPAATRIYAIGVTNIKKDAIHPVGGIGWATESRNVNINHTLTGTFTRHDLKAYEVRYESYDLESATVAIREITDTKEQTDALSASFTDIGYVPAGTGIVLRQDETGEAEPYSVPFFTPALTTTQPVGISTDNMMRPNIVRTEFRTEEEIDESDNHYTRFLLTNINWLFTKGGDLAEEERSSIAAPAAGFYRLHQFTAYTDDQNELARQNTLKANTAFMAVPSDRLPIAIWNLTDDNPSDTAQSGGFSRRDKIAIRNGSRSDTTGMEGVDTTARRCASSAEDQREVWYTLSGQRIERPHSPGIYILNGKKVKR